MTLQSAQQAYHNVQADFEVLETSRDRALRFIDIGEQTTLSLAELQELAWLKARQDEIYPFVQAAEGPLLRAARAYLCHHPEILARYPAYGVLAGGSVPPGRRDEAIRLALRLGTKKEALTDDERA